MYFSEERKPHTHLSDSFSLFFPLSLFLILPRKAFSLFCVSFFLGPFLFCSLSLNLFLSLGHFLTFKLSLYRFLSFSLTLIHLAGFTYNNVDETRISCQWLYSHRDHDDDDCFYYHSWRNNVVIAYGTLSSWTQVFHMCDTTHLYVWHWLIYSNDITKFVCMTLLIYMRDITLSYVW